jgi:LemA protein
MRNWVKIVIAIAVVVIAWAVLFYNGTTRSKNEVDKTVSMLQTRYQRRAELIPNLVEVVKASASFEKTTQTAVTEMRAAASQIVIDYNKLPADQRNGLMLTQDKLSTSVGRLIVVSEKYPELSSNERFLDLQTQLKGTENRIRIARNQFSEAVKNYNNKITTFPNNILANVLGFKKLEGFMAELAAQAPPVVNFKN